MAGTHLYFLAKEAGKGGGMPLPVRASISGRPTGATGTSEKIRRLPFEACLKAAIPDRKPLRPFPGIALRFGFSDQGHAHQVRKAAGAHLAHDVGAMDFDRAWTDPEIIGNRFVWQPGDKPVEHLALSL